MSGWAIAIPYQWLEANVLVVYAIGWMRLRGRPPLVMFASLAALILFLVCFGAGLARHDPPGNAQTPCRAPLALPSRANSLGSTDLAPPTEPLRAPGA